MLEFALRQVAQAARRRPPAGAGTARLHARTPTCCASSRPSTARGPARRTRPPCCSATCSPTRVAAADGDLVLKMDDDDWYGPDFVADLLLARAYSGAELVGTPAEIHYLVPKRRHRPSRPPGRALRPVRRRRHDAGRPRPAARGRRLPVRAQLRRRPADRRRPRAGAATYRTHGLGYLLRRNASGHTWQVDRTTSSTPPASPRSAPVSPPAACSSTTSPSAPPLVERDCASQPNRSRAGSVSVRDWRAHGPG